MEFCSECGTMLMPQKKGKYIWLVCPDCGHYRKLKKEEDYKIGEEKSKEEKPKVAVVEEETTRKIERPDFDIDTDAYAEIYEEEY